MRLLGRNVIVGDSGMQFRLAYPAIKVLLAALAGLWLFTLAANGQLAWIGTALRVGRVAIKWAAGIGLLVAAVAGVVPAVRYWAARHGQLVSDLAGDLRLMGTVLRPILQCQFGLRHAFAVTTLLAIFLGVAYTPGLHPFLMFFGSLYACGPWACLLAHKLVGAHWPGFERLAVYALLVTLLATALWFAFSSVVLARSMQLTVWQLTYLTLILWAPQIALYVVLRELLTGAPPARLNKWQLASRGAFVACCLVTIVFGVNFASRDSNQHLVQQAVRYGGKITGDAQAGLAITITGPGIDDTKAHEILKVRGVTSVTVDGAGLSEQGYGELCRLPKLRRVSIRHNGFTAAHLRRLCGIRSLEELELRDTWLGAEDLALLKEFPKLKRLTLIDPGWGDVAFKQVCQNVALEHLDIDLPNLSDRGFVSCTQLSQLKSLRIRSAFLVTDKGLAVLHELPQLNACEVRNTGATWPAIQEIMKRCAENKRSQAAR